MDWKTTVADRLAFWMPIGSAALSLLAGVLAVSRGDNVEGILVAVAGLMGAAGVIATAKGARVRDDQLRLTMESAEDAQFHIREGFGS